MWRKHYKDNLWMEFIRLILNIPTADDEEEDEEEEDEEKKMRKK